MSQVTIVIDGNTLIDKDIGEWTNSLPELQQYIQPNTKPQPWIQALLIVLTQSLLRSEPFTATVSTRAGGWTMDVGAPLKALV